MKIGFPFGEAGSGGTHSWVKRFGKVCEQKGYQVVYNYREDVDVFINIANATRYDSLVRLKNNGAKIIHRIDGLFFEYHLRSHESVEENNKSLARNINLADLIISQSKFSDELVTYLIGDTKIPRSIIYNGANTELFKKDGPKIERDYSKKMVLSVAYWGVPIMAEFSIKNIVNTARLLPEYEFWILGLAFAENEEYIRNANLKNITRYDLRNPIPRDDMPKYLRTADLILHTRPHDACSNLIIEAMNVNKPIVGLNSGSTPDLLGDAGLVAKCDGQVEKLPLIDCEDLAKQIVKTFDNYDYYQEKITQRSKSFSEEEMCNLYFREIDKLLK